MRSTDESAPRVARTTGALAPRLKGVEMHEQVTSQKAADQRRKVAVGGHPGIYSKGSRFLVVYRHKGRQRARSFRTLSEATRFKGQVLVGDAKPTSREPFKRYAMRWLDGYSGRTGSGVGAATRASYRDVIERIALPFFGTVRMDEIDAPLLRDFLASLAAKGLAPSTVRRYFAPVRALLATAYEDGLIRTNPAQGLRIIVPRQSAKPKLRLTPDQTRALLAEMPREHADLAFLLAATGLRISEALAARWRDLGQTIDGRPVLNVPKSKTPSGERSVPLSPETVHRLVRRRADAEFGGDSDPIFPNRYGRPLDAHNYRQRVFNPATKRAAVEWATPHDLRHGLASLMADHNYTPAQIAAHLGHADGGVLALRTYIHPEAIHAPECIDATLVQEFVGVNAGVNATGELHRI